MTTALTILCCVVWALHGFLAWWLFVRDAKSLDALAFILLVELVLTGPVGLLAVLIVNLSESLRDKEWRNPFYRPRK